MSREAQWSRREFLQSAVTVGVGALWLPRLTWTTPQLRSRESFRIVFFTDVHARVEWETPRALALAAQAINRCAPDLIVGGGDYITDGFDSTPEAVRPRWDVFMEMWESLKAPRVAAIGNHDYVAARPSDGSPPAPEPRQEFLTRLGLPSPYQVVEAGPCVLLIVDSIEMADNEDGYRGWISLPALEQLEEQARRFGDKPRVLVTHLPVLTAFYSATRGVMVSPPENRVVVNNREVLDWFNGKNLLLVLQGHLHVEEFIRWRGATFITGGAISGRWWRGAWHGTEPGFGIVTFRKGRVEWEYRTYGWVARRPPDA